MTGFDNLDVLYTLVTLIEWACFAFVICSGAWLVKVCCWDQRDRRVREHVAHHPSASESNLIVLRPGPPAYDWALDEGEGA